MPKEEPLVLQDDLLDQIIRLGELRDKGILTEEEFAKQKEKILAQR
ncbi:MAG: SHOCT domain-containing protein [Saprospiraceae bacterium]|nr:SHOCT domain-containing protein [Saprospiraceae bacterium]